MTSPSPAVKVGDVFVASWGYDQTNINYEQVVGVTKSGKSVYVKPIPFKTVGEGPGKVVADVDNFGTTYATEYIDGEFKTVEKDTTQRKVIKTYERDTKEWNEATGVYEDATYQDVYFKWASFADAHRVDPTIPQYDTIAAGHPGH